MYDSFLTISKSEKKLKKFSVLVAMAQAEKG
jgi:hypothetical protein